VPAVAGPELPGNLNNPFGGDLERTREVSKQPSRESECSAFQDGFFAAYWRDFLKSCTMESYTSSALVLEWLT
jgi:hypothetical protein